MKMHQIYILKKMENKRFLESREIITVKIKLRNFDFFNET